MPIQPMTLEEAVKEIVGYERHGLTRPLEDILKSYTLHVATVARPEKDVPDAMKTNPMEINDAIIRNQAIADYFAAIKSEIEKN